MMMKKYLKYYLLEIFISIGFLLFFGCASPSVEVETVESGKIYIKSKRSFFDGLTNPFDRLKASVVAIIFNDSRGSGFLISKDGYILTAAHVVGDAKTVKVRFVNGREISGEVLRKSITEDISLLKINGNKMIPILLNTNPPKIGSKVVAIANAPTPKSEFGIALAFGTLSAYRNENEIDYIQSDAILLLLGADGGPLVDNDFNAIGVFINARFLNESIQLSGSNYFLPIADALHALDVELK